MGMAFPQVNSNERACGYVLSSRPNHLHQAVLKVDKIIQFSCYTPQSTAKVIIYTGVDGDGIYDFEGGNPIPPSGNEDEWIYETPRWYSQTPTVCSE